MENKNEHKNAVGAQQYQIKSSRKNKKANKVNKDEEKSKKESKKLKKKKHKVLKRIILTCFILVVLAVLGAVGVVAGIFYSDKWDITAEDLIANGNTEIFDSDNKLIAVLSAKEGDANRKVISLDEMGKYTVNAYIAIEDKRFYEHSGVDFIRTANATMSYILHHGDDSSVGGGSTITQQLVKNLMKDKADKGKEGAERKIREMSRAYKIESMLSKQQILEKYLNIIFIGGNELYGVEYGARYYFAKSAKDLDLAESAFLAGINNAPNMYNPYSKQDHSELIKKRTKTVLNFMKEQNRISDDPEEAEKLYNEAIEKVEKGLKFEKGKFEFGATTYFVEEAVRDAAEDLAEAKDIDVKEATLMIKSGGYKLYTTQVSSIQKKVVSEMAKDAYVEKKTVTEKDENGKNKKVTYRTNAGMTIIEHSTGKVVAMGGDLQQDVGTNTNYATSEARQTGSAIKPLANVAPGLEEGIITAATVYDDVQTKYAGMKHIPKNVGSYYGLCTVRKSIERSSNIVNLKIMTNVGVDKSIDYLHEFGLTTYEKGVDGLLLGIGGAVHSSSTLQMATAYAALANGGVYIEPTFYTKMTDSEGNTVVKPNQETRRVISEANAFIISDILTDVVNGREGTAGPCAISGMDVAAKTGTTNNNTNKWLCGYTPYYAAATWYGYGKDLTEIGPANRNNARSIWANVMKAIHKKLEKKKFKKPDSVVTAKICLKSGKLATSGCGSTYTEYFAAGTVPKECDGHIKIKICKESGKIATEYCPEVEDRQFTAPPEKETNATWTPVGRSTSSIPKEKCTIHTQESSKITIPNLIGRTESQAKSALEGLNIQVVYETHSDQANGIVLRQSLEQGTKVDKGVAITIIVNKIATTQPPDTNTQKPDNSEKPKPSTNIIPSTNTTPNTNTNTSTHTNTVTPENNVNTKPNTNTQTNTTQQ